ncbi:MAG TPA: OmpA family protein [Bdellovibrionota bacterium]|nr:OmpA family protein [Bdellovibrionota bacterium]
MRKLAVVFLLLTTGCVTSGKYKDLENEHDKTKASLAAAEMRISELNGKLGITESAKSQLDAEVAEMKTALEEQRKRKAETDKRLAEFRELTAKFKSLVNSGQLTVKVINGKMTVALSTDVLFPSGSAKLSPKGLLAIKEVSQVLSTFVGRNFQVEGHTDNVPIKTASYPSNWELASARAMTVLKTMLDSGMAADHLSAASYGDTQPVATNTTDEGKSANRRIAIIIVPDLSALPGYDQLNELTKS